jgi:hypothetical protein
LHPGVDGAFVGEVHMRVCVAPIPPNLSQAMYRVARALRVWAPRELEFVRDPAQADLQVVHVIGPNAIDEIRSPRCALIQYCLGAASTADGTNQRIPSAAYEPLWARAELVWSYLDLAKYCASSFYYAPLGIDPAFVNTYVKTPRDIGVLTSGYVSDPCGEAIEEMAWASDRSGLSMLHLGPDDVQGMARKPSNWQFVNGLTDTQLAQVYCHTAWVSGLRHVEGFEMPVIEGLACGARPIVFDRPDMTQWYTDHAVFVQECSGDVLVRVLAEVLERSPVPVTESERAVILDRFNWASIIRGFWERIL